MRRSVALISLFATGCGLLIAPGPIGLTTDTSDSTEDTEVLIETADSQVLDTPSDTDSPEETGSLEETALPEETDIEDTAIIDTATPEDTGVTEETDTIEDTNGEDTGTSENDIGRLIITEVMFDPAIGTDNTNEWIEIHNTTNTSINLQGLAIADDDETVGTFNSSYSLAAGEYAILAIGTSASTAWKYTSFVPDGWYGTSLLLGNTGDVLSLSLNGVEQDIIPKWTGSIPAGHSFQLDKNSSTSIVNDIAANWCEGVQVIELNSDYGTPGAANSVCP